MARVFGGMFAVLAAIVAGLWVAGYFYLWWINLPPLQSRPWTVIQYWLYYGSRPEVAKALTISTMVGLGLALVPVLIALTPKKRSLHGDARFASMAEIKKAGLLGVKGIILGRAEGAMGKVLMLPGQLSVLLAAPPRSGKGAGVVNTNMLNWPDSAVVLDIRQESWNVTSGYRAKHGQQCYLFNPVAEDGRTCQWNPLSYVSADPVLRVNDLQKIADQFFPDPLQGDPFWPSACRTLFLGLGLYLFETPGLPRTIGEMVRQIMYGEGESVGEHWRKIIETRNGSENPLSDICLSSLYDFINTSANTQSSIRKSFTAKLELWLNPIVDAATSGDSFDLRDLRKKRISLYIGVAPGDLARLQVILNLLFQQIIEANTREMPEQNPVLKYQLLMMMDEFTAIGKVPALAKSVSYLGGYNIRLAIIIQSPSQLYSEYGREIADTIIECMGAQIVFAPKDNRHAKDISENLGFQTWKTQSFTAPSGLNFSRNMGSVNTSEHGRALLLPQEVRALGAEKQIILMENIPPIMAKKLRYFQDRDFKNRVASAAPVAKLNIKLITGSIPRKRRDEPEDTAGESASGGVSVAEATDRPITAEDLDRIERLNLEDFSADFDSVELPEGDPPTDEEIEKAVEQFLNSFEQQAA